MQFSCLKYVYLLGKTTLCLVKAYVSLYGAAFFIVILFLFIFCCKKKNTGKQHFRVFIRQRNLLATATVTACECEWEGRGRKREDIFQGGSISVCINYNIKVAKRSKILISQHMKFTLCILQRLRSRRNSTSSAFQLAHIGKRTSAKTHSCKSNEWKLE